MDQQGTMGVKSSFAFQPRTWRGMAAPYSKDLRERAVAAALKGDQTRAEAARQFDIGEATLYVWLRRWREESTLEARPHGGGQPPSLDEEGMRTLESLVEDENDRTLDEYRTQIAERTGVEMSRSAMHRALEKLKLRRKKDAAGRRAGSARRAAEASGVP